MEPTKDNTTGTAEFDDFEDKDPDDCYCESFFQEASHKTKLNRDKNKIKDDLKYNKSTGVGEIHDSSLNTTVPIDISFDNKRPTGTGNLTYKNGKHAVGMNINPNDLNRGHGFTKYLHEKNHILQDLRKRNDENDNNDLNMISAFISKHSNEIKTPHSSDKDEYLADLNVARTRGYDKTIRMLQDMMIKPLKSSPSAKNAKSFINKSADDKANRELSGKFLNELYEEYSRMLEDEKSLLNTMQASRNVGDYHFKSLEKRIKKMESDLSSKEHFMNTARQMTFVQEVNKRIDEHNSDLKLRILFLRDMKKVDSTNNDIKYKKEKSFTESGEPILSLLATINNRAYDNTSQLQNNIDEFIIEHFDVVDNMDFVNGMILSYVILDYVEDILHDEGDVIMENEYTPLSEFDHFFQEAKLKSKARNELDDSDFALVYKDASGNKIRKYPINDEAHVKAAARMFPRGVPNKYRKEVAGKILRRAHKFGIDTEGWKSLNKCVSESFDIPVTEDIVTEAAANKFRAQYKDKEYFDEYIDSQKKRIEKFMDKSDKSDTRSKILDGLYLNLISAEYSDGYSKKEISGTVKDLFKNVDDVSSYNDMIDHLSLAILFDIDKKNMSGLISNKKYDDLLVIELKKYIDKKYDNTSSSLKYAKQYQTFYDMLTSNITVEDLNKYVDGRWYSTCKGRSFYDTHKKDADTYVGYWCWIAAAVLKISTSISKRKNVSTKYIPVDII